ncbi:MAG: OmpA family protein [Bacteroidales bacterium]|nr:OmpA family protein [Bacteroidales bacterium]
MKKILLLIAMTAIVATGAFAQSGNNKKGKKGEQPYIEGRQKVRESDYATFDKFTNFNSKDMARYYSPFDYTRMVNLCRYPNPDWDEMKPVMNYLEKVSRAQMTMCAIFAVNPEVTDANQRKLLVAQGMQEAKQALDAFDEWRQKREWRNKIQYKIAEVDYRYFKGANFYNEQKDDELIHVGLLLYFGSKKKAMFDPDTNSRTFVDIKFFPNDATIVESWYPHIDEIAEYLKENERKGVLLTGYSDNQGTAAYCIGLSRQRAVEIKKALQMRGIDESRIEVEVKGDEDPIGDNNTLEGRVANNRVSVKIQ